MMIYVNTRSKKKNPTKKQKQEYENWLKSINNIPGFSSKKVNLKSKSIPELTVPAGRVTPKYSSMVTPGGSCTKPIESKVYTGTAMKGIGTLHKSNAVPIFTDEEAKAQAAMRR